MGDSMGKTADNNPKYTTKRGGIYYLNFRKPDGGFFRKSLGTDSLKAAEAMLSTIKPYIPLVQSGAMSVEQMERKLEGWRDATQRDFDAYKLSWLKSYADEAERIPANGRESVQMGHVEGVNAADTVIEAKGRGNAHLQRLYSGSDSTAAMLLATLERKRIAYSPDDVNTARDIAGELDMGAAMLMQAYEAFYSGDIPKWKGLVEGLRHSATAVIEEDERQLVERGDNHSSMLLSDAWELFCKEKGQKWRTAIANENNRFYEVLRHVIGDVPVDTIKKQDMRKVERVVKNLPRRNELPYARWTLEKCITEEIPEEDLISSANVLKYFKVYSSFFKKWLKEEKDILQVAPTEGISIDVKEKRGGRYSREEMARILIKLRTIGGWQHHYFTTLIYTGARRSEIANLTAGDLHQDKESGRWWIFIKEGKTKNSRRKIPLHNEIVEVLRSNAKGKPSTTPLFTLPSYETISVTWHEIMEECGIPVYDEWDQKRVLHALRHTFISEAMPKANPTLVKVVAGHDTELGISDRYFHKEHIPILELATAVDVVNY